MRWCKTDLASVVTIIESGSRPKGGASTETGEIPSVGGKISCDLEASLFRMSKWFRVSSLSG